MKKSYLLLIITVFYIGQSNSQENNYWINAKPGQTKIFTITFMDEQNGKAIFKDGDGFFTTNGGASWDLVANTYGQNDENVSQYIWEADIYCSVMQTTDSGLTWHVYEREMQEHFCGVYLKDNNSGYHIANDFLKKVTMKILDSSQNGEIDFLINSPQQCTEYYRSADEGWALGWCIKDYKAVNKNSQSLKKRK